MPWANEDRIEVLVLVEVFLAKGCLPVRGLGLTQLSDRLEAVRAKVGQNVFDPPQAIRSRFNSQADRCASLDKVLLDVARHQPPLLGLCVRLLETGKVHI